MRRTARAALYVLLVPLLATCGSDVIAPSEFVASIVVSPATQSIAALGLTQQFSATARSESGTVMPGKTFTWATSAPNILSIDPATGLATAHANGTATVVANTEGVQGSASVTVAQVVTSVTVTAEDSTFEAIDATKVLNAVGTDSEGNPVSSTPVSWESLNPTIVSINSVGIATAMSNGTATISATADGAIGTMQLSVSQLARQVAVTQQPAGDVASGSQLPQQPVIQLVDANGYSVAQAGVGVTASIASGGGTLSGGTTVNTDAAGAASFTDLAISGLPGRRVLSFSAASLGATVFSSEVSLGSGPADPAQSTATLSGSPIAGQGLTITILARDALGNHVGVGGGNVVVSVTGANSLTPPVSDLGDGTYVATINATVAGTNTISITLNGVVIAGSPFVALTLPGPAHGSGSTASIPSGTANAVTSLQVQALDVFGNAVTSGGASVVVNVSGANSAMPIVSDNGDGTYSASYTPTVAGTDFIEITLNGTALSGSPFTSVVSTGSVDPAQSMAVVPAAGTAGVSTPITLAARDASGNVVTVGGASVTMSITGANVAAPMVADNGDGTYSASYVPTAVGTDNIAIAINGAAVTGSPFSSVVAPGSADATSSTVSVPTSGVAGVITALSIQAVDAFGNLVMSGGDSFALSITGANTASFQAIDNGDGTYRAEYIPTVAGVDNVVVTLNSNSVGASPYVSTVAAGSADAAQSVVTLPASGIAGVGTAFFIQLRDTYANLVNGGGDNVVVIVSGANAVTPIVSDNGDGTYSGTYTPSAVGVDNVAISVNGAAVSGSPFVSTVSAGSVDPSQSTATVAATATAGVATAILVQARDVGGNVVDVGGATVLVSVIGSNPTTPPVVDNGDGTYAANYVPGLVGSDTVTITMNGTEVLGSPFSSTVAAGAVSATQTTAIVPAGGVAGSATAITVQTRDAFGNVLSVGGATVTIAVAGANTASPVTTDLNDGTYTASYVPTVVGTDVIAIVLNGAPIGGSPYTSVVGTGSASASQSSATVPDGTAGQVTSVIVQVRDENGNDLSVGGAAVTGSITGANSAAATVLDNGDGTYLLTYTPLLIGTDNVAIALEGVSISGSPYTTTVGPGAADATQSITNVPANGTAGVSSVITIAARDAYGNVIGSGGETVSVVVSGANTASSPVIDHGDGTYSASYTPVASGSDLITVTVNGVAASGSPFASIIGPGNPDPSAGVASVPGTGTAGVATNMTLTVRDAFGNQMTAGGESVVMVVTGANVVSPNVTDNGDGTYSGVYVPTAAGTDMIAIQLNGADVNGSPFSSVVGVGEADASQTTASVPATGVSQVASVISVQARDINGNALTSGGASVAVTIGGANSQSPSVIDNGDGTYSSSYTPVFAGTDNITITLNGIAIGGSPFQSLVTPGAADGFASTATVPAVGVSGIATAIVVQARDVAGNPLTTGGATVSVVVTGANSSTPVVTDNGDGTYTASYTPSTPGTDNITITLDGSPLSGSPFGSVVGTGSVDPTMTSAVVPTVGTAGVATDIIVQARDANGNAITSGGETVTVTITGANPTSPTVLDVGDGTYTASYTPATSGTDNIAITMNGTAINDSPFPSNVVAGPPDAAQSLATVPASGALGVPTNLVVQSRDANGNNIQIGGATIAVTVSGANPGSLTVVDVGDGTYTTSYTPANAGTDNFSITLDGNAIGGSPYSSVVAGAPGVDPSQSTALVPAGTAGAVTTVTITARDVNGNPMTTGGETVAVAVTGANTANPVPTDNADGTYTATYVPTVTGTDNLAITINGTAISGSPYSSGVAPGPVDASQSLATVPNGSVGGTTPIAVQARDSNGNPLNTGGATVLINVSGANTASPPVTDVGDGTYTASYTPASIGNDLIAITLNGVAIAGSPYSSTVSTAHGTAANSYAIVPAGAPGVSTDITIQARDALDNKMTVGGATVLVSVSGANTANPVVVDNGDGTYSASYTPSAVGSDDVAITFDGSPILGSSYVSTVSVVTAVSGKISYDWDGATASANTDVIVANEDGSGAVNLTSLPFASDERPAISPDGTKIAFNSDRDGDHDIYVMNVNGSGIVQLTTAAGRDRHPVWSPDGTKILFLSERDLDPEVYVMNADGSNQTNLTNNGASDLQADWSPDGTQIVYYTSRDNDWFDLFTMNADGTNHQKLLDSPGTSEVEVSWGVGGIVFVSNMDTGSNLQLYKIQPDGTGLTRLSNHANFDYIPEFNADGSKIIFISNRNGPADVYIMNADGTGVVQITSDSPTEWAPKFQP